MAEDTATIRMNRQQRELFDKTVDPAVAARREELILKAPRDDAGPEQTPPRAGRVP